MNTQIAETSQQTGLGRNLTLDAASMASMVSLAEIMATGKATIPTEYRNSPGDCLAVVMQAVQWGMNPFAVAQKTYFVSGKLGYEAQLVNAVITALAPTKDRLHFEWFGDWTKVIGKFEIKRGDKGEYRVPGWKLADEEGLGVRCWATLKGEDRPRELVLFLAQARTRNSTLWADDPRQQLAYLVTKRWSRMYCPDVIMGVYTPDELEEVKPERDVTPQKQGSGLERLMAQQKQPEQSEEPVIVRAELSDIQMAALEENLELMSLCQSIDELKSVSAKIIEIGVLPDAETQRVKVAYQKRSNAIKASLAAEAEDIPL